MKRWNLSSNLAMAWKERNGKYKKKQASSIYDSTYA
jgi:hypothetical protein